MIEAAQNVVIDTTQRHDDPPLAPSVYGAEISYVCVDCTAGFDELSDLQIHQMTVHFVQPEHVAQDILTPPDVDTHNPLRSVVVVRSG